MFDQAKLDRCLADALRIARRLVDDNTNEGRKCWRLASTLAYKLRKHGAKDADDV